MPFPNCIGVKPTIQTVKNLEGVIRDTQGERTYNDDFIDYDAEKIEDGLSFANKKWIAPAADHSVDTLCLREIENHLPFSLKKEEGDLSYLDEPMSENDEELDDIFPRCTAQRLPSCAPSPEPPTATIERERLIAVRNAYSGMSTMDIDEEADLFRSPSPIAPIIYAWSITPDPATRYNTWEGGPDLDGKIAKESGERILGIIKKKSVITKQNDLSNG